MKRVDITGTPYYDDYNKSKGYVQIVANPGRVEQGREFTQLQTALLDFLKRLSDSLYAEGFITSGCGVVVAGTDVTIQPGAVYMNGIIRDVPESLITITGVGTEIIGIKINSEITTSVEDSSLKDPAQGFDNYQNPGADRIKETPAIVLDDPDAVELYTLINGVPQEEQVPINPFGLEIEETLARRTYDESGSYCVWGLRAWCSDFVVSGKKRVGIASGKAYIEGFEIEQGVTQYVDLDQPTDVQDVVGEVRTYNTGTDRYKVTHYPLKLVSEFVAQVEVEDDITKGIAGGTDILPLTPVLSIISVIQGVVTYVQGVDYQLTGDGVDWSLAGAEPNPGTTYTVVWHYNKILVLDVDYEIDNSVAGESAIVFIGAGRPVDGSSFTIDYDFYLSRIDAILMDKNQTYSVVKGQPDVEIKARPPFCNDPKLLTVTNVLLNPAPDPADAECIIHQEVITRLTMTDLCHLSKRMDNQEYNDAICELDRAAEKEALVSDLIGIFTDGFYNFNRCDPFHADWDAAFDVNIGELTLVAGITEHSLAVDEGDGEYVASKSLSGRLYYAPYTEGVELSQLVVSHAMNVNPYSVYEKIGILSIDPIIDTWIETSTVKIIKDGGIVNLPSIINYIGASWSSRDPRFAGRTAGKAVGDVLGVWGESDVRRYSTTRSVQSKIVLDEAIAFMRQIVITLEGNGLIPLADNLIVKFDGVIVTATGVGAYEGTDPGTLKADVNGITQGTFTIPAEVRTGTVKVEIYNNNNNAETEFMSEGRRQVIEATYIRQTVLRRRITYLRWDPLAQSFIFTGDRMMTSVGLFFSAKDSTETITVQIRDVVNGYPGTVIYAEKVLRPSQVNISADASAETKITFDEPIYLEANKDHCVALLTSSNQYKAYVGQLGQLKLDESATILKQLYTQGVLFSSSNAATWTAHQDTDLMFKIYTADFSSDGVITFTKIEAMTLHKILVTLVSVAFKDTAVKCQYKLSTGDWVPINPYELLEFSSVQAEVDFRILLEAGAKISPIFCKDNSLLIEYTNTSPCVYISKNVVVSDTFSDLKQTIEACLPSGSTLKVYYATDVDGDTWIEAVLASSKAVDEDFTRYTYETNFGVPKENLRTKVTLETTNLALRPRAGRLINIMT